MAKVTVTPEEFTMVRFDSARIRDLTSAVADAVGLPNDLELRIEVDEQSPLGRTRVTSFDPVTITTESGAFEDPKRIRDLSDSNVQDVLGRLLMRVCDRLDPAFGDPPADKELSVQQHTAWDAYAVGRCDRLGLPTQRQRRLYHFRIRHGFTDASDHVFNRLWSAEGLTWADLVAASEEAAASRPAAPAKGRAKAAQGRT